jgi:iron transport multicopper oxidase
MGPLPQSTLINDKSTETYSVQPGKRYLFRIIDVSTLAAHFVQFQGHNMTIVAVDGVRTKPTPAQTIRLTAGQRYDVIITGIENPKANYAFITQMDVEMLGGPQPDSLTIANGILQYNPKFGTPQKLTTHGTPIDDFGLSPLDGTPLLENPDQIISLDMTFHDTLAQGELVQRAYVNGVSYISPTVPTLYSMMTLGKNALNPEVYGKNTNSFVLQPGQIIELNVQNMDSGP